MVGWSKKPMPGVIARICRRGPRQQECRGASSNGEVMSAAVMPAYEWKSIPWKTFQRKVYKLQMRIYRASRRGDARTVHRLQRLLMTSFTPKSLHVRTVTQAKRAKKTSGYDAVKSLS